MKKVKLMVIAVALLGLVAAGYGDEQKPKPPALKVEVKVEVRDAQWALAKLTLQQKQLEVQWRELSQQIGEQGKIVTGKLGTALERSGLDPKKYTLDPDTLEVTAVKGETKDGK